MKGNLGTCQIITFSQSKRKEGNKGEKNSLQRQISERYLTNFVSTVPGWPGSYRGHKVLCHLPAENRR
jgi:hypothetical protein